MVLRRRHWVPVAFFLLQYIFLAFVGQTYRLRFFTPRFGGDYLIYREAAAKAARGEDPYRPVDVGRSFLYPPASLGLVRLLDPDRDDPRGYWGMTCWMTANVLAVVLALLLLAMRFRLPGKETHAPLPWSVLLSIVWLGSAPFLRMVETGQIEGLVLLSVVSFVITIERGRVIGASGFLASAILMKMSPAVLLVLPFLWPGRGPQALVWTCVWLLVLTLVATGSSVLSLHGQFLSALHEVGGTAASVSGNVAFSAAVIRWLGLPWTIAAVLPLTFSFLCWLLAGGAVVWLRRRRCSGAAPAAALLAVLMVLGSPLLWLHHAVVLLFPLTVLLADDGLPPGWRLFLAGLSLECIQAAPAALYTGYAGSHAPMNVGILALLGGAAWAVETRLRRPPA